MASLLEIIIALLDAMFNLIAELYNLANDKFVRSNNDLQATFVSPKEYLRKDNLGFAIGDYAVSREDSFKNMLCAGPTGSNKTVGVVMRSATNIIRGNASIVLNDPSGQLYTLLSQFYSDAGYKVKMFNCLQPEMSVTYNILERAKSNQEIQMACHMLVSATLGNNSNDPYWNTQATSLLVSIVSLLKTQPKEHQHMANVRQLLLLMRSNPEFVEDLFCKFADDALFLEFKAIASLSDKLASSIISTALAAVQLWSDTNISRVTATDTLDLHSLRNEKTALFICNSVSSQSYLSPIVSCFFQQLFSHILSKLPEKDELDLFFLIDESPVLKIPLISSFLSNCRKHRASVCNVLQDVNQFISNYGISETENIKTNSFTQVYFPGSGLETATRLEQVLGKYTYEDHITKTKKERMLLSKSEIRTIPKEKALVIMGPYKPILMTVMPYYKHPKLKYLADAKPITLTSSDAQNYVPLIQPPKAV